MTADQAKAILRLAAKRVRVLQSAKAAGLTAADCAEVVAEIDKEISDIRTFSAGQASLVLDKKK